MTTFTNVNMVGMNRAQVRRIARDLNVPHNNLTATSSIVTAIKAK